MSMDRSLKVKGSLFRHRNVLTRAERIKQLVEEEKFDESKDRPVGLPKVAHRKVEVGGKSKKKKGPESEEEGKDAEKK
ncbi:MAG: small basic protein [Phycisphaerales bacterium]|nr:small basic protein [Phycisphaerales bacterium]